jgi:hypothetical protein
MSFVPDQKVHDAATAYAQTMLELAQKEFGIRLDWSDDSIKHVETILESMHNIYRTRPMTDDWVRGLAAITGSYVGEVYRRNHGATWGMVTLSRQTFPGMEAKTPGRCFWPWGRTENRIRKGAADSVIDYYQWLVSNADGPPT